MEKIADIEKYELAIKTEGLIKAEVLKGGKPRELIYGLEKYSGGYCVVFPFTTANGKVVAVRCWHAQLDKAQERTCKISDYLQKINLPYFVEFKYMETGLAVDGQLMPVVIMDWVDAVPFKDYIQNVLYDSSAINGLAEKFLAMVKDMHSKNISHGDLQHENIMVKDDGNIVLVDYDSMYVPELNGYINEIAGKPGYQHPARKTQKLLSPKADYFSELVIYTSLKGLAKFPELWTSLQVTDTDSMLFTKEDFDSKGNSEIFRTLEKEASLSKLVAALKKQLECSSIEDLQPLEEIVDESSGKRSKDVFDMLKEEYEKTRQSNPSYTDEDLAEMANNVDW